MGIFTAATAIKVTTELVLGICIKLLIDNGRIHYADFVNDFLFWLPGVESVDSDGLSRECAAAFQSPTESAPGLQPAAEPESTPVAA